MIPTKRALATLHPNVPEPNRRHFVAATFSRAKSGISRHLISLRFKSTADSASLNIRGN